MNETKGSGVDDLTAQQRQARTDAVLTACRALRERKVLGPMATAEASLVVDVPEVLRVARWIMSGVDPGDTSHDSQAQDGEADDEDEGELYYAVDQRQLSDLIDSDRIVVTLEMDVDMVGITESAGGRDVRITGSIARGPNAGRTVALTSAGGLIVDVLAFKPDGGCPA